MKAFAVRALGVSVLLLAVVLLGVTSGCSGTATAAKKVTASGVRYIDVKEGEGKPAGFGDVVHFAYVGKLADGKQFEKCDHDHPAMTRHGWHSPIVGLDDGLEGMKEGGIRTIWVPASLGYGVRGSPSKVPPNADLVFENVEMIRVMTPPEAEAKNKADEPKNEPPDAIKPLLKEIGKEETTTPTGKVVPDAERKEVTLPSGLKYLDMRIGDGREVRRGNQAFVLYTGKFTDGRVFESSRDKYNPFKFIVGDGKVIKGWEEGVVGMKVGGQRVLIIPPNLAYGDKAGGGKIPPNSTLVFELELMKIR
jgi:peptidylprolyl isomerase